MGMMLDGEFDIYLGCLKEDTACRCTKHNDGNGYGVFLKEALRVADESFAEEGVLGIGAAEVGWGGWALVDGGEDFDEDKAGETLGIVVSPPDYVFNQPVLNPHRCFADYQGGLVGRYQLECLIHHRVWGPRFLGLR